ncbi:metal-binding protein ZinT [Trichococcus alkaliphilus]|uniref:metal-binding protein ZinT n=1 Tax=Trichococcus alkaliphilus TaxID=2052943 RepID=UPI000D0BACB6|nr:metal-binding protein ZinT [Trichococcus alkaliphilus]
MHQNHRTFRWMIGSLLVLSLAACQSNPETEEALESNTTATEITIESVNLQNQATVDAANGIFEDNQVADRPLSDWEGEWQSVYPYLLDGTLDSVFAEKARDTGEKTAEEYKDYYTVGYESTFTGLTIAGDTITFYEDDTARTGTYAYSGYQILTYESGKKGVRYLFERTDDTQNTPKYVQFSDHIIEPTASAHFHIYLGDDSHATLLEERDNWPTFYPAGMDGDEIVEEMLQH